MPRYSVIVPVYNRPEEAAELLESLVATEYTDFEVLIVEDGSTVPCEDVVRRYDGRLDVRYYAKPNSGPGQTRNFGAERARGEWLLILDSDVMVPPGWFAAIDAELRREDCDAFGGPDRSHPDFTPVQKAISYAMTSFWTTGGIRGGKARLDKFYPRSFNEGFRTGVYRALGGFSAMRFGEDIDLSIRLFEGGYRVRLFPEAWVWHKRRTDLRKFFRQVHNSGIARINLYKRHPKSLKAVHFLPALWTLGMAGLLLALLAGLSLWAAGILGPWLAIAAATPMVAYFLLIFIDSLLKNKNLRVAALSVPAAAVQLSGYGSGFLRAAWRQVIRGKSSFEAFRENFYK